LLQGLPVCSRLTLRYRIHVLSDLSKNPLLQYMARLAPSSQQTMRYILQDAADRLGLSTATSSMCPGIGSSPAM
jgi:hypothetical protein